MNAGALFWLVEGLVDLQGGRVELALPPHLVKGAWSTDLSRLCALLSLGDLVVEILGHPNPRVILTKKGYVPSRKEERRYDA